MRKELLDLMHCSPEEFQNKYYYEDCNGSYDWHFNDIYEPDEEDIDTVIEF